MNNENTNGFDSVARDTSADLLGIVERMEQCGELPGELETQSAIVSRLLHLQSRIPAAVALLVAAIRQQHFPADPAGWLDLCQKKFNLSANRLHHLRRVGDMLFAFCKSAPELLKRVFHVDSEKLYIVSGLNAEQAAKFVAAYRIDEMDRIQLRDTVNRILNRNDGAADDNNSAPQYEQPALFETLETIAALDEKDLADAAARFDGATAWKANIAGFGLLEAGISFYKRTGAGEAAPMLEQLEHELRAKADEIAAIRAAKQ